MRAGRFSELSSVPRGAFWQGEVSDALGEDRGETLEPNALKED
jgi:hypothetical protein